ncbi:hypothetical protein BS78_10G261800 [Paspalum vaginatum]|nr:hypothetical protein BS78_10G261800 [Paspalum vaginatum]
MVGGRGGIRWPWRSYREETTTSRLLGSSYSISSFSSSGTISSSTNNYTSTGSSSVSLVVPMYFDGELDLKTAMEEEKIKYIKTLVHEFSRRAPAPAAKHSSITNNVVGVGDMSVPERWLKELGVGWVLGHLADGDDGASTTRSAGGSGKLIMLNKHETFDVRSWIRALAEIVETIGFTTSLFPADRRVLLSIVSEEEQDDVPPGAGQLEFAEFFQETMSAVLAFVDLIAGEQAIVLSNGVQAYENLLAVHSALSWALPQIRLSSYSPPLAQVQRIQGDMVSLLSSKQAMVGAAVWSKMEEIRSRIVEPLEEDTTTRGGGGDPPSASGGLSGIHEVTHTVASYIRFLRANYLAAAPIVSQATILGSYVPRFRASVLPPLESMILEIVSSLEEKLAIKSRAFSDQSLGFLFLLNNSHFIWHLQDVQPIWSVLLDVTALNDMVAITKAQTEAVTRRVDGYMKISTTEFHKTYTTQKLWKVPDPELRERLRRAIIEELVPAYTKYIKDNNATTQRFSPQEIQEMLQEMFEG